MLPNKSNFDYQWYEKQWAAAKDPNNPFDPFNNIKHYTMVTLENIMFTFNIAGLANHLH